MRTKEPYPSIRVFQSDRLEVFTHVHPWMIVVSWAPVALWMVYRSIALHGWSVSALSLFAIGGVLGWTLFEYWLHRFVFHYPPKNAFEQRLHFLIHGIHHDDPKDLTRLVMPPLVSLCLAIGIYFPLRILAGAAWADPLFGFLVVGYLWYDLTHYAIHRFHPKTAWGRMLKRNHMAHHYADSGMLWGVTTPLWDYVFGSYPKTADSKPLEA